MTEKIIKLQKEYYLNHIDSLKEIFNPNEIIVAELFYQKQLTELAIVRKTKFSLPTVQKSLISLVGKIIMHRAGLFVKSNE